jgi:hypothetical protein
MDTVNWMGMGICRQRYEFVGQVWMKAGERGGSAGAGLEECREIDSEGNKGSGVLYDTRLEVDSLLAQQLGPERDGSPIVQH